MRIPKSAVINTVHHKVFRSLSIPVRAQSLVNFQQPGVNLVLFMVSIHHTFPQRIFPVFVENREVVRKSPQIIISKRKFNGAVVFSEIAHQLVVYRIMDFLFGNFNVAAAVFHITFSFH